MTSMEKETGKALSVIEAGRAFEKIVREKFRDLRRDREAHALSA